MAAEGEQTKNKPLSNWVMASYGAPALPLALSGLPIAVYLPVIYADPDGFGLSLAVVGVLITLSRFTDVITDPIIGYLSDKWWTRWGRRKPFVLFGTPIYALSMWALFIGPDDFGEMTFMSWTFSTGLRMDVPVHGPALPRFHHQGPAL